jgi:hypothetical protein
VLVTRQKTTPAGSGWGGAAGDAVAANETITFWQARSRQTSTVAPALALSPSQLKSGLIEVEIEVDSGAMRRGAVRGVPEPEVEVGAGGVAVGAVFGVDVGVDGFSLGSAGGVALSGIV